MKMNKFQIFAKKTFLAFLVTSNFLIRALIKSFSTKTILIVSKQKIKSFHINPAIQVIAFFFVLWLGNIYTKSIIYNSIIQKKSVEIVNLEKTNKQFEDKFLFLNENLKKINIYFQSVSGVLSKNSNTPKDIEDKIKNLFGNLHLNSQDKKIAAKIADSNIILDDIKVATIKRIKDLEEKLSITGIDFIGDGAVLRKNLKNGARNTKTISLNSKEELLQRQGGPFQGLKKNINPFSDSDIFSSGNKGFNIEDEIEYLTKLERFLQFVPLAAPMKNYYVSSLFGKRKDPIRNRSAQHNGLDFAGEHKAKVFSPSSGKVILAGKFSSYGTAVIIDHGYGLTTRYGHLSKVKVRKGDLVKKDQVIGMQGSSGRSTGPHLHYEVRYNNTPLNPRKFLQAGKEIFNHNNS
ncbi:MAG: murein DD-endopeptidase MepM/ murein hydrolase activator NlpD [Rickettsiales bacterium]|jgi:murein DD-endopeptidase MepM/ murein hydrolase activator NlpD